MKYFSVWTQAGLALRAEAIATGVPLVLKEMAIGDAGTNDGADPPAPNRLQDALRNEKHRQQINDSTVSPSDPNQAIFSIVVVEAVGGFWIKEVGLFSENGTLVAVGSLAPSYKADQASGSPSQIQIDMYLLEATAEIVKVEIDPTAVLATKSYVDKIISTHETAENPHPQYALQSQSILVFKNVPVINESDFIYHPVFGLMAWNEAHSLYRSVECGRKVHGWSEIPLPGYIEANGATYSKTGNYKGLWTAVKDYGLVVAPASFSGGNYLFADVDTDNFRVPDLRGYFDRNTELAGRNSFAAQGDAIRNIVGNIQYLQFHMSSYTDGCFTHSPAYTASVAPGTGSGVFGVQFNAARQVPTAAENRPINTAYPAWIKI